MKLLYLTNSEWEEDYIIKDLCGNIKNLEVIFYNKENIDNLSKYAGEETILTINSLVNIDKAQQIVIKLKPSIIIFLSDEVGNQYEYLNLSQYTKLFLKHYSHNLLSEKIIQIPLGYVKGMLNGKESEKLKLKKISERKYKWCFIGSQKSDRHDMFKQFLTNISNSQDDVYLSVANNPWKIDDLQDSPKNTFEKYSNSIFVPIGRGNVSLDCFRIYEAIVCGAIPVIVGKSDEINSTFYFHGKTFARIQAENWEQASKTCKELLEKPEIIQEMQEVNKIWWRDQISTIRKLIKKALKR